MQDNQELKLFIVSNYLINTARPVVTLCSFMSLLYCYNERLMCVNIIQTL